MISKIDAKECYVYIVPPGETEFVTAGRFVRTIDRHGNEQGKFIYGGSYRARENAVPIDPIAMKLGPRTYTTTALKGISAHYGMPAPITGAGGSSKSTPAGSNWANLTICCIRRTTARARLDSV